MSSPKVSQSTGKVVSRQRAYQALVFLEYQRCLEIGLMDD